MAKKDVAREVWNTLKNWGCSDEAIAGILGNMEGESALIADRWQSDKVGNKSGGYGLVQWTPATKHINWAKAHGLDFKTVSTQCAHIKYEADHGLQFAKHGTTFWKWLKSGGSPEQKADDFIRYYERPKTLDSSPDRQRHARKWYDRLHGTGTGPATGPSGNARAIALNVLKGKYGNHDARKSALGSRYAEVQAVVNHWYSMAPKVWKGQYGKGPTRISKLGADYDGVQYLVDHGVGKP
jgi:hypothetical protein